MNWFFQPIPAAAQSAGAPATVTAPGGLHHISDGIGDTGEGARVPQTLHTIEQGISS
jgi:hypothetical protein